MNLKLVKKSVILLTIVVLLPIVTSCSTSQQKPFKVPETIASVKKYAKKPGGTVLNGPYEESETREPVSTIQQDWNWSGNTFQYEDIIIKLPTGWEKATDEDMEILFMDFNKPDMRCAMFAEDPVTEDPVTEDNILLVIQDLRKVPPKQVELLDEKTFLTLMKPGLGNKEGETLNPEIKEVMLGGKTYTYVTEIVESTEKPCIQYYAVRKMENEMIAMIFTCDPGVLLEDFAADMFL